MGTELDELVKARATKWLEGNYDETTKQTVKFLIDNDKKELTDSFHKDLEFGTGGLRGIMGVGTNRMNIYTVGMATQGLSNYLKKCFGKMEIKVAVAHDSRNNSRMFAEYVADIFVSNGFTTYLFDALRPTPELSFAIRLLGCQSGVNITASHNPKEYNGYKAYWADGAQVTSPHDNNIIDEVGKIKSPDEILRGLKNGKLEVLGDKFDTIYLDTIFSVLNLSPKAIEEHGNLKIVYTPIHGAGVRLVPAILRKFGFTNVSTVKEQNIIDGDFPTVDSPNPEERTTMKMALELAQKLDAELVLATDPDADRIGISIKDDKGEYILVNGNQTCVLLTYYLCRRWSELGRIDGHQYIIKTIVTSEMVARVAESFGVKYFDSLTGFKYIAEIIRQHEGTREQFIGGGEESFGYLPGDFVRDKDAVASCALAAEMAAWAKSCGLSPYDLLKEMYVKYGFFKEGLVSLVRKGKDGQEEISKIMAEFRSAPPKSICDSQVVVIRDYLSGESKNLNTGEVSPINVESSNVLQFLTMDDTIVSVRPSGTEPKIKFYIGVNEPLKDIGRFYEVEKKLDSKIEQIKNELGL